jgi:gamma-glutamyltranspeptidase/glutathione hydrolase
MRGAIAAGHELTARAGADALERGGTAVDALVAAAAMSWAAEPALTGPCGGGFALVRPARGRPALLDAFTSIPGINLPADRRLGVVESVDVPFDARTTQVFHIGPATCAVPGVVPGLHALHARYGRLAWRELLSPAAHAADRGVAVNPGQHAVLKAIDVIVSSTAEARAIFYRDGRLVESGDSIRQADLAGSIELLAEQGPTVFATGALATAMVDHQAATGGSLTVDDLAAQRPVWRRPLTGWFRGHELLTNAPPSSGGALISYMLAVLDGFANDRDGESRLALMVESMRAAARVRDRRFERLLHSSGLRAYLFDPATVRRGRESVAAALAGRSQPAPALRSDHGTTHISVVDAAGNAAAFTASNGSHSGVIVPGTGLHLNNMMGEEDLAPGRDLRPGTRLTSMQAPTIVTAGGELRLVVGSSGSNRLRSAITQVIVNTIDRGMPIAEAVAEPRVHVEGDRIDCEGGIDPDAVAALEHRGESINRFEGLNLYFGGANAVASSHDGRLLAAGDPRRDCFGLVL